MITLDVTDELLPDNITKKKRKVLTLYHDFQEENDIVDCNISTLKDHFMDDDAKLVDIYTDTIKTIKNKSVIPVTTLPKKNFDCNDVVSKLTLAEEYILFNFLLKRMGDRLKPK